MSILEDILSGINENYFLKEFSFSKNRFRPSPREEVEFADQVVALADLLILYQAKERTGAGDPDKWFEKKVLGLATRQVRDTLGYLNSQQRLRLTNRRGHSFEVDPAQLARRVSIVIYAAPAITPRMVRTRHHMSTTAGAIHIVEAYDYDRLCRVLVTPAEIVEYFEFRATLAKRGIALPGEKALVGQYLSGELGAEPNSEFAEYVDRLEEDRDKWDMSHILRPFGDRVTKQAKGDLYNPAAEDQYYDVLTELALLTRVELGAFRQRFELCLDAARAGSFQAPLRMITERGCGYLFLAIPPDKREGRLRGLQNLTIGSKYEQKLDMHVGVVICRDGEDFLIDWALVRHPWVYDAELEQKLKEGNPFLPLKETLVRRYRFD